MLTPRDLDSLANRQEKQGSKIVLKALKTLYTKMAIQALNDQDIKPDQDIIKKAVIQFHTKVQIEVAEWQYNYLERTNTKALQLGMYDRILSVIRAWVLLNTGASIKSITNTSLDIVKKIIAKGQAEGWGSRKIGAAIRAEAGSEFTRYRATIIARTEGTRAASEGARFGAEQWEKITGQTKWKGWSASADSRTRDSHAAMLGSKPIPGDQDFKVGGKEMDGPGDPRGGAEEVVACRCRKFYMSPRAAQKYLDTGKF